MSRFHDDFPEMSANIGGGRFTEADGPETDRLLTDAAAADLVTGFLAELRAFADGPAPEPSAELLAAFGGASPLSARRRQRAGRLGTGSLGARRLTAVAAAAVTAVGLTGVAAARNELPGPAQRMVARVVEVLTPFDLDPAQRVAPKPSRPVVPVPASQSPAGPAPTDPATTPGSDRPGGTGDNAGPGQDGGPGAGDATTSGDDRAPAPGTRAADESGRSGEDSGATGEPGSETRTGSLEDRPTGGSQTATTSPRPSPSDGSDTVEPSGSTEPRD